MHIFDYVNINWWSVVISIVVCLGSSAHVPNDPFIKEMVGIPIFN